MGWVVVEVGIVVNRKRELCKVFFFVWFEDLEAYKNQSVESSVYMNSPERELLPESRPILLRGISLAIFSYSGFEVTNVTGSHPWSGSLTRRR